MLTVSSRLWRLLPILRRTAVVRTVPAFLAASFALAGTAAEQPVTPEAKSTSIGYPTVVEALLAVQKGMDAQSRMERGWTIVDTREKGIPVQWFFTQKGHPAHPAAIKRVMNSKEGAWDIQMAVLCEGQKAACDKLTEEFRAINEKLEKASGGG